MLHLEFAISPNQIRNIADLMRLVDRLGFERGAVLSRFPNSWLSDVSNHLNATLNDQQIDKATEMLRRIQESRLVSFGRQYVGNSWGEAAETSHRTNPFHRVIDGVKNERPHYISDIQDLDEIDFTYKTQFNREAASLAGASKPLLLDAEKVTIYDNYICPTRLGSRKTLLEVMRICQKPVELHVFSEEEGKRDRIQREQALALFQRNFPANIRLFWYWLDDAGSGLLHQRGLFTSRGGLIYDRGFDEPGDLDQRRTLTTVTPMPRDLLEDRSRLFNPAQLGAGLSLVGSAWQSHP
ncbi:hypothetical protein [Aeromonas veronii]|uniref:hypothetical protein n=1 Tax=Aeromonas veronii TaxID=654 RepID=UPI002A6B67DD|nr:hypothetical protein [Aeromonas veronii]